VNIVMAETRYVCGGHSRHWFSRAPGEPTDACVRCGAPKDKKKFERRFRQLAGTWAAETGHLSNVGTMIEHPAYREIIAMGLPVVPLLLEDLRRTHLDWFPALAIITGQCPIPEDASGQVDEMVEAWIQWGEHQGII
jgi:hypothetical protein